MSCGALDNLATVGSAIFHYGKGALRRRYAKPYSAHRFLGTASRRTGYACCGYAVVAFAYALYTFGHSNGYLLANGAIGGYKFRIDAQNVTFGIVGVAYNASHKVCRCARHCGEFRGNVTACATFGDRQLLTPLYKRVWRSCSTEASSNPTTACGIIWRSSSNCWSIILPTL